MPPLLLKENTHSSTRQLGEITAYYTAFHGETPMVMLPSLGLFYLADAATARRCCCCCGGYVIKTNYARGLAWILERTIIKRGGDFRFKQLPSGRVVFLILDSSGVVSFSTVVWHFEWQKVHHAIVVIQRLLRRLLLPTKSRKDNGFRRLHAAKAFADTDFASALPREITAEIMHAMFHPAAATSSSTLGLVKSVQTASYARLRSGCASASSQCL